MSSQQETIFLTKQTSYFNFIDKKNGGTNYILFPYVSVDTETGLTIQKEKVTRLLSSTIIKSGQVCNHDLYFHQLFPVFAQPVYIYFFLRINNSAAAATVQTTHALKKNRKSKSGSRLVSIPKLRYYIIYCKQSLNSTTASTWLII